MSGELAAIALGAYLLGSIPSGYLLGLIHRIDVREQGSGNIGATNVARSVGTSAGVATLAMDVAKGALPVLLVSALEINATTNPAALTHARVVAAVAAVCGHIFSIFLGFRGGKGVATTFGALLALAPLAALGSMVAFAAVLAACRIVSLASMVAVALAPLCALGLGYPGPVSGAATALAVLVVLRHGDNLSRLRRGTEPRIGAERKN